MTTGKVVLIVICTNVVVGLVMFVVAGGMMAAVASRQ